MGHDVSAETSYEPTFGPPAAVASRWVTSRTAYAGRCYPRRVTRPPPIWIAELPVVIVHPNGQRVPGHIAVGQPYVLGDGDPARDEALCPVEITDVFSGDHPIHGGGTFQALLLGVQFLGAMLHTFVSTGGRVLDADDGEDVDLAVHFGPMLRDPAAFSSDTST